MPTLLILLDSYSEYYGNSYRVLFALASKRVVHIISTSSEAFKHATFQSLAAPIIALVASTTFLLIS